MASSPETIPQRTKKYPPISGGYSLGINQKIVSPETGSTSSTCNVHGIYVPEYPSVDKIEVTHRDAFDISRKGGTGLHQMLRDLRGPRPTFRPGTGLFICLIEAPEPRALRALQSPFPSFPKALLSYAATRNAFGRGTSLTPEWRSTEWIPGSGLSFVDNYFHMTEAAQESTLETGVCGYELGSASIRSMPLAVWTGGITSEIPIIMVMGQWVLSDVMKFIRHCEGDCGGKTRYRRLQECPQWIYHDLYSTFTDWNVIWDAVQIHLEDLDQEVHELLGTSNVLERMRRINKATAANIMLRESLAMQEKSLQAIHKFAERHWPTEPNDVQFQYTERCKEISTSLEHYSVLAKGNLEQLQNLLSMMVSLEQIAQGNSVARLNLLAFIFLPLSFIASIFGMTQFTISPQWYPAYALPMLTVTIIAAVLLPSIVVRWDRWKRGRRITARNAPAVVERGRSLERAEAGSVFKHKRRSQSLGSVTGTVRGH
ncbi:hypothetical protein G7Y89_g14273 [Cudoniella acicularis]|uniref:Uncharacterized protein n=1 Tax=Cudoniella acicularis TaxID=354080 RepID=A0A8H4VWR4_9HELO|nr:hypothetical protein G7Y89_g14273 [Cudoniella acicularis]